MTRFPSRRTAGTAALTVLAMISAGCGSSGGSAVPTTTPSVVTTTPAGTATAPTTAGPPASTAPSSGLDDGRHPVYVTGIDVPSRTLTVDLIQFLTGDAARRAYAEDHPEDPEGPPNDYYIVNDNPRLRTIPVAAGVAVSVVWLGGGGAESEEIEFGELPDYFAGNPDPGGPNLWFAPFWVTVQDGTVVSMEEQFIP